LYFTQLAGDIPQSQRKLFDTLCSLPRPVIQVFAEQELGLAQYSSKRVIDLVANAGDELSNSFKLYPVERQLSVYIVFSISM
jgi:hypothetical protein